MGAPVDLRSDTVSKPSAAMRQAMAGAEVGDDRYGDDPTVNRLQDRAAELTGKEAAVFLPTGTLCNQIALRAFTRSGHFVACEADAHIGGTEAASSAALSGIVFRRIRAASRGLLTASQIAAALADPYQPSVADLVTVENTHQVGGGSVLPADEFAGNRRGLRGPRYPALPGRRAPLQRLRANRRYRRRLSGRGRRDDVLPVQGARRADRLHAGRQRGVHPGGPAAQDLVRRPAGGRPGCWRRPG